MIKVVVERCYNEKMTTLSDSDDRNQIFDARDRNFYRVIQLQSVFTDFYDDHAHGWAIPEHANQE